MVLSNIPSKKKVGIGSISVSYTHFLYIDSKLSFSSSCHWNPLVI